MVATKPHKTILRLKPSDPVYLLVMGICVLLIAWGWQFFAPKEKAPAVPTMAVSRGSLLKTVSATGKVVPNFEVEIKAKASGKIIRMPYDVSDFVPNGALLVQLAPIDENRNVSQAADSLSGYESKA